MSAQTRWSATAVIIAAASALAGPVSLAAQSTIGTGPVTPRNAAAEALHARAEALFAIPSRYPESARLLVRAAHTREASDNAAVKELIVAAKLYRYAGHVRTARSTMEQAARRALEAGDVVTSAHAYADAAFLAMEQKDWDDVRTLTTRVQRLAAAPLLADEQRTRILDRIDPIRVAIQTARR